jgi:hypothetical protein
MAEVGMKTGMKAGMESGPMRSISLVVAAMLLFAAFPLRAEEGKGDVATLAAQGAHYLRKRRFEAAIEVLEKARALPGGDQNHAVLFPLARAYYDQVILERAFPLAEQAAQVASTPGQKAESMLFLATLQERFGSVTLKPAEGQAAGASGRVLLEDRSGLIHPKKKQVFDRISSRLASAPIALPFTLYLPFGAYAANGVPFAVESGRPAEVALAFEAPPTSDDTVWWLVGGGTVLVAGAAVLAAVLLSEPGETTQGIAVDGVDFLPPSAGAAQ